MKVFGLVSAALGVGTMIGWYVAIKLEERYVLRPLAAYVDICVKQCEEVAEKVEEKVKEINE